MNRPLLKPQACGNCWSEDTQLIPSQFKGTRGWYTVVCPDCGIQGPPAPDTKTALANWDQLANAIERGNR